MLSISMMEVPTYWQKSEFYSSYVPSNDYSIKTGATVIITYRYIIQIIHKRTVVIGTTKPWTACVARSGSTKRQATTARWEGLWWLLCWCSWPGATQLLLRRLTRLVLINIPKLLLR